MSSVTLYYIFLCCCPCTKQRLLFYLEGTLFYIRQWEILLAPIRMLLEVPAGACANLAITLYLFQIILSQEKMIQKLNDFIQNLQQQLLQCRENNKTVNSSRTSLTSYFIEIQRQHMMDD
jgi:hypothetical protein